MDLEKYLVERDKKLQKIFDLVNRLEPALEFDEGQGNSQDSLGVKQPAATSSLAAPGSITSPGPAFKLQPDSPASTLISGAPKANIVVSGQEQVESRRQSTDKKSGARRVTIEEGPDKPIFSGKREQIMGPDYEIQVQDADPVPMSDGFLLPMDQENRGEPDDFQIIDINDRGQQRHGFGGQLERVPEASNEVIGMEVSHPHSQPLNEASSRQPGSSQVSEKQKSSFLAADFGLYADPLLIDPNNQSFQEQTQDLRLSSQGQQRTKIFDSGTIRDDPKSAEQQTRKVKSISNPSSQPSSIVNKGSSKLGSNTTHTEQQSDVTSPVENAQKQKKALVITPNEQELMDELKDRLVQFMKEEENLKQMKEAKGLFSSSFDSSTKESQQNKKFDQGGLNAYQFKKQQTKSRKDSLALEQLLGEHRGQGMDESSEVTPRELLQQKTMNKYLMNDKKSKDMLLKTFVNKILDKLIGESDNGYQNRPKYFTVADNNHKQQIKLAIKKTLQELGPSFGLQGALIPTDATLANKADDASAVRLTNELKTEIMHNAMLVLRNQVQSVSLPDGVNSLRKVVNMQDGILGKMLDTRKTQTSKSINRDMMMTESQRQHFETFIDKKKRSISEYKEKYGEFIQTAQIVSQLQLFQSLGGKDTNSKKMQLTKKINDMESAQKSKEDRLRSLYTELDKITRHNIYHEVVDIQVSDRMLAQKKERDEANQILYNKNNQEILESVQAETLFNVHNLESCVEAKKVLQTRNDITDIRLKESLNLNKVYKAMLRKIRSQNQLQTQMCKKLEEKEENIGRVVNELEQINHMETQRQMQINSLHFQARQKIISDQDAMEQITEEKESIQRQEEEETQQVLYQILQHTRKIKRFKEKMKELQSLKLQKMQEKQIEMNQFQKKQDEIRILNRFWQVSLIKDYRDTVDNIQKEFENDCDLLQQNALEQVVELKTNIIEARADERFGLIYTDKEALKARNLKSKIQEKKAKWRQAASSIDSTPDMESGLASSGRPHTRHKSHVQSTARQMPSTFRAGAGSTMAGSMHSQDQKTHRVTTSKRKSLIVGRESGLKTQRESEKTLDLQCSSENSSVSDKLQTQFDTYTVNKDNYDFFFSDLLNQLEQLSKGNIIDIFLQTNIRNKQLREAFDTADDLKQEKTKYKEQLQQKISFYQNEMKLIGDFIQGLEDQGDMRMAELVREMNLGDQQSDMHTSIAQNEGGANSSMLESQFSEEPTSLLYPISLNGMNYYMERLAFKSNTLYKNKTASVEILKQFIQSFKDCLGQALFKINMMQQHASGKIEVGAKENQILRKLSRKYLSPIEKSKLEPNKDEDQSAKKQDPRSPTKIRLIQSRQNQLSGRKQGSKYNSRSPQQNESRENEKALSETLSPTSEDLDSDIHNKSESNALRSIASQEERSSAVTKTTEMHKIKWDTNQPKRLHQDLLSLIEAIYMADTKFKLSERLARRLENIESKLKKKSGSSTFDPKETSMNIRDFDPIFGKHAFNQVRQGVLGALCVQPLQEKQTLRNQQLASKNKMKAKFLGKLKEQSKKQMHDIVELEYAKESQRVARKQKAALRRRLEQERLEKEALEKPRNLDDSSDSSEHNKQQTEAALFKEMHDAKIRNYMQQFEQKNEFRREKTELIKKKYAVQQVQRTEKYFMKDLKEQVSQRQQEMSDNFAMRYDTKTGSSVQSSKLKTLQPIDYMQDQMTPGPIDQVKTWQDQTAKMGIRRVPHSKANKTNNNLSDLRRSLMLPSTGGSIDSSSLEGTYSKPNLSKLERTKRLYGSLVDNVANLRKFQDNNFKDPRSQKLMNSLGMTPKVAERGKDYAIREESTNVVDLRRSLDISKMQHVINSQFSDLKPRGTLNKRFDRFMTANTSSIDGRASTAAHGETDYDMRPVTSLCFDLTEKRALQTASLKERIKINKDLTKSVKLKPRDPTGYTGPMLMQDYLQTLPNILPGILNKDLPPPPTSIRDKLNWQIRDMVKTFNGEDLPQSGGDNDQGGGTILLSPSQRDKLTINMFNTNLNPGGFRPGTVAKPGTTNQQGRYRSQYTTNKAFNMMYKTAEMQKQRQKNQI